MTSPIPHLREWQRALKIPDGTSVTILATAHAQEVENYLEERRKSATVQNGQWLKITGGKA